MSLTIREIIKFENLKNFKLVAGEGGLDRFVRRTGIVDFEFVQNLVLSRPAVFDEDSFVLSSLLFAHGDSDKLYHAIKVLIEMNVSGLAYKDVIFKELPKNVIELANRENFPIFVFDDSVYFEDVIADLTIAIRQDSQLNVMELKIRELVKQDHSRDDVMSISERILPNFSKYLTVYFCSVKSIKYQRHIDIAYKNYVLNSQVKKSS